MVKRIAIVGPESTGKSALSKALAEHYHTIWVPEFARDYLESLGRPYVKEDLLTIAQGQILEEDRRATKARNWLFCDTNLIVIKIWSEYRFGEINPRILEMLANRTYDYYLLTNIDLPWEEDPLREHPNQRQILFETYRSFLKESNLPFSIISGSGAERLRNALRALSFIG